MIVVILPETVNKTLNSSNMHFINYIFEDFQIISKWYHCLKEK